MKQKIKIRVAMSCDKCRSKALSLVAGTSGVDSVEIAGDLKDQVVVVGDGVDSIKLTTMLRKKVGPAHLLEVADATKKKEEDKKKPPDAVPTNNGPWPCPPYPLPVVYELAPEHACSIL